MKLDAHWMPFTANKAFRKNPRMLASSSGMYWTNDSGAQILDMTSGLWCTNLGHSRIEIAKAMFDSAVKLGYAPSFNFGHIGSFQLAERLADLSPGNLKHVFFTNSGSEAIDTALKMVLAYQVARGKAAKRMFIARERSYHGVNLGGTALCGIVSHTRAFGRWVPVDHLPHTQDLGRNAFTRGLPTHGIELADELERLINLHGAENVAAVLVEPVVGAGGVLPPPAGYLKRLREICDRHDVLLIFDEVVTGFGRLGSFTASIEFGVTPDLFTVAKGLTSGAVPMGAVICSRQIHDTVISAADGIEFFHGYTYSAHPIACAAALACLDIYEREGLFTRVNNGIGRQFENALHGLRGLRGIVDIRNYGLLGAVEFEPQGTAAPLGIQVFARAWGNGLMIRAIGDSIILSPPLIVGEKHLAEFDDKIRLSIREAVANSQPVPGIRVAANQGSPSRAAV